MSHDDPHSRAADAVHDGRPVEAQYVRGGRKGNRILILLVVSVFLAALALLGFWALAQGGLADTNPDTGGQAVDAAAFQGDSAAAPAADAPTTATGQPTRPATGEAPNVNAPNTPST